MQQNGRSIPGKPHESAQHRSGYDQLNDNPYKVNVALEDGKTHNFDRAFYSVSDGWLRIFQDIDGREYVTAFPSEVVAAVDMERPSRPAR